MLCALIMAGGKGERFWPLSTDDKPKQFLKLLGNDTMIQMTVNRIEALIPIEKIFIVTAQRYLKLICEQLPNIPLRNIIVEPVGKNTAPCIRLAAFTIDKYYKNATIAVLPSDHLIVNELKFRETLKFAGEFVEDNEGSIVTLGIKPERAETGYGYIKHESKYSQINEFKINKVESFIEKPNKIKASFYLQDGKYLWNGGMFVWKTETILKLMKEHLNKTYNILDEIATASDDDYNQIVAQKYPLIESISIDYAIMEKAENIFVIPCEFGWDDIGTWNAVERYREKDCDNNVCLGDIKNIESHNNIIFGKDKPIIIVGLEDVFVVESDDVIFIGSKKNIEKIKEIKKMVG